MYRNKIKLMYLSIIRSIKNININIIVLDKLKTKIITFFMKSLSIYSYSNTKRLKEGTY